MKQIEVSGSDPGDLNEKLIECQMICRMNPERIADVTCGQAATPEQIVHGNFVLVPKVQTWFKQGANLLQTWSNHGANMLPK